MATAFAGEEVQLNAHIEQGTFVVDGSGIPFYPAETPVVELSPGRFKYGNRRAQQN